MQLRRIKLEVSGLSQCQIEKAGFVKCESNISMLNIFVPDIHSTLSEDIRRVVSNANRLTTPPNISF